LVELIKEENIIIDPQAKAIITEDGLSELIN